MAEVEVRVGFTQNIGNFENLKTEVSWSDTVRDDENHEAATDRLFAAMETKFVEKANEVYDTMTAEARKATQIKPRS
jgi:hypothetical protein